MATTVDTKISASYTKYTYTIDPFTTSNATQQTAFSIPLSINKAAYVIVQYNCNNSAYTNAQGGSYQAVFMRAAASISRSAVQSSQGILGIILGNFVGAAPSVDIVANTSTQAIDVKVTGQAATTINWHLEVTAYISN